MRIPNKRDHQYYVNENNEVFLRRAPLPDIGFGPGVETPDDKALEIAAIGRPSKYDGVSILIDMEAERRIWNEGCQFTLNETEYWLDTRQSMRNTLAAIAITGPCALITEIPTLEKGKMLPLDRDIACEALRRVSINDTGICRAKELHCQNIIALEDPYAYDYTGNWPPGFNDPDKDAEMNNNFDFEDEDSLLDQIRSTKLTAGASSEYEYETTKRPMADFFEMNESFDSQSEEDYQINDRKNGSTAV